MPRLTFATSLGDGRKGGFSLSKTPAKFRHSRTGGLDGK
jgi:hypothetical protein